MTCKWTDPPIGHAKLCALINEIAASFDTPPKLMGLLPDLPPKIYEPVIVDTSCPEDEMRWTVRGVTVATMLIDPADMPPADDSLEERIKEMARRYYRKVHP